MKLVIGSIINFKFTKNVNNSAQTSYIWARHKFYFIYTTETVRKSNEFSPKLASINR